MATTVSKAFGEFDEYLNLDPAERRKAQDRHNEIRDLLEDTGQVTGSFLQGSFARKTMLKPLKDVDIVILMNLAAWPGLDGPDGPAAAMAFFRRQVQAKWPDARFDEGDPPAGKALRVAFSDVDFTVDLVPALDGPGDYVRIGDRHDREWIISNTRIQITRVATRNLATAGSFVHQVRMLKAFTKHHPELEFVKGIAMESLAYQVIDTRLRHPDAIALAMTEGARLLAGPLLEPAGEDDMTESWTPLERQRAVDVFTVATRPAQEALRLEAAGDEAAAVDVWHSLFGEGFPVAPAVSEAETLQRLASGSLTSAGRASVTLAGATPEPPGRAWRSR